MLNYLGPSIGSGPIASQLPAATPGTMPSGIPHVPSTSAPLPVGKLPAPAPMAHGHAPAPAHVLAAILRHAAQNPGAAPEPPPLPEYGTTTQENGSILLHLKNADGSLGPVVKVLPPIKVRGEVTP
jgi:hypothetical protein